ncbi:hypothetical protein BT63DRAFT_478626 [Microthyrium microscopicum]|uniref:Uncharacterized protein n=1 Tax=Microthyrium microscopicum TaxID=703497 RepID=A0A6A6UGB7_9PEZI|nr:hypothetical protein BT63DRAFT_478626 [Microthyrium microscopicum]
MESINTTSTDDQSAGARGATEVVDSCSSSFVNDYTIKAPDVTSKSSGSLPPAMLESSLFTPGDGDNKEKRNKNNFKANKNLPGRIVQKFAACMNDDLKPSFADQIALITQYAQEVDAVITKGRLAAAESKAAIAEYEDKTADYDYACAAKIVHSANAADAAKMVERATKVASKHDKAAAKAYKAATKAYALATEQWDILMQPGATHAEKSIITRNTLKLEAEAEKAAKHAEAMGTSAEETDETANEAIVYAEKMADRVAKAAIEEQKTKTELAARGPP